MTTKQSDWTDRHVPECDGRCCALIYMSGGFVDSYQRDDADCSKENLQVKAMLIPLGPVPVTMQETAGWAFECTNYNENANQCCDFENRPRMCSAFPYGTKVCEHCNGEGHPREECTDECETL